MKILAFDTATEVCTVALQVDDDMMERHEHLPQQQANLVLPMIDELMRESGYSLSQLDAIAFGRGPGSFTGLRIAAGVAQGLAFAADLPVLPVSTLAIIAQTAYRQHQKQSLLATIDARMNELYWAEFTVAEDGLVQLQADEQVSPVTGVQCAAGNLFGVGSGFRAHQQALQAHLGNALEAYDEQLWPQAQDQLLLADRLYRNGGQLAPEQAIPVYLRDNVAQKKR